MKKLISSLGAILLTTVLLINLSTPVLSSSVNDEPFSVYFTSAPSTVKEGNSVTFTGTFRDIVLDPENYYWTAMMEFSDDGSLKDFGTIGQNQSVSTSHTYGYVSQNTTYSVKLTVIRHPKGPGFEVISSTTTNITVQNNVPTVSISPKNATYNVDQTATLTANGSGGNTPYSKYQWSGACSGSAKTTTISKSAGTYTCTVKVWDKDNDTATASTNVTFTKSDDPTPPDDDDNEEVEEDVKGVQTCKETQEVEGYVFFDENGNGERDENEEGYVNALVKVYTVKEDQLELYSEIETDSEGYFFTNLCPGSYTIRLDTDELEDNVEVTSESEFNIELVEGEETNDILFYLEKVEETEDESKGFNWLWVIIPLVIAAIGITVYVVAKKKQEDK